MTKFRLGPVTARQALGTGAGWVKPGESTCHSGSLWISGMQGQGTASGSGVKGTPAVIHCRAVPLLADKHPTGNVCEWRMMLLIHIQGNWKGFIWVMLRIVSLQTWKKQWTWASLTNLIFTQVSSKKLRTDTCELWDPFEIHKCSQRSLYWNSVTLKGASPKTRFRA